MRLDDFVRNEENVKRRSKIESFGQAAAKYNRDRNEIKFEIMPFTVYTTKQEEMVVESNDKFEVNAMPSTEMLYKLNEISIKVTNIPLDVTKDKLVRMFQEKNPNVFFRLHLVCERREEGADMSKPPKSRGFAYISVPDEESGKEIIRNMGNMVISGFKINMELLIR